MRQGKKEAGDRIDVIGSTAYQGSADALFECRKTADGKYTIRSDLRYGYNFEKLQITIDIETGEIKALAAWKAEIEDVEKKIKDYLRNGNKTLTAKEIRTAIGARTARVKSALKAGVEDGTFIATKDGRGSKYSLAPERDPTTKRSFAR